MKKRTLFCTLSLFTALLLCSCQGQPFSESDFTNKLFPNGIWDLIIQLLALVVLFIVVFLLGYKPLKKMLDKRRQYVEGQLNEAESAKKMILEASSTAQDEINRGKLEAEAILEQARRQAEIEAEMIVQKAKEEAEARRLANEEEIRLAQEASRQETRQQIIDVALQASEAVLGREVDEEDSSRMVNELISTLEGEQ